MAKRKTSSITRTTVDGVAYSIAKRTPGPTYHENYAAALASALRRPLPPLHAFHEWRWREQADRGAAAVVERVAKFLGRKPGTLWHTWAEQLVVQHDGRPITEEMIWTALKTAEDAGDYIHEALTARRAQCKGIAGHHHGRHAHVWKDTTGGRLASVVLRTIWNKVTALNAQARRARTKSPRSR